MQNFDLIMLLLYAGLSIVSTGLLGFLHPRKPFRLPKRKIKHLIQF